MFKPLILLGSSQFKITDVDKEAINEAAYARKDMKLDDNANHTFAEDSMFPDVSVPACKELVEKVEAIAQKEIHSKLRNVNVWSHILEANESTMFHTHGAQGGMPPMISWVYYSKAPKNAGNIVFTFECNAHRVMQEEQLEEDKVLFFSGEIPHFTQKNTSGQTRISISGNLQLPEDMDWQKFDPENWLNYVGVFNG